MPGIESDRWNFLPYGGSYCECCNSVSPHPFVVRDFFALCVPCVIAAYEAIPDEYKRPKGETSQASIVTVDAPPPHVQAVVAEALNQPTVEPIRSPKRADDDPNPRPRKQRVSTRRRAQRK